VPEIASAYVQSQVLFTLSDLGVPDLLRAQGRALDAAEVAALLGPKVGRWGVGGWGSGGLEGMPAGCSVLTYCSQSGPLHRPSSPPKQLAAALSPNHPNQRR